MGYQHPHTSFTPVDVIGFKHNCWSIFESFGIFLIFMSSGRPHGASPDEAVRKSKFREGAVKPGWLTQMRWMKSKSRFGRCQDSCGHRQMFSPGEASGGMRSITDSFKIQLQLLGAGRSFDVNAAGRPRGFHFSDIMKEISQTQNGKPRR